MSGSILGSLADDLRVKASAVRIPDLRWAERILDTVAAGGAMPIHSVKVAKQALEEDAARRDPMRRTP